MAVFYTTIVCSRFVQNLLFTYFPVGKITKKAVCRSAFLTTRHCILSVKLTKNALLQTAFLVILPTGLHFRVYYEMISEMTQMHNYEILI